MVINCPELLILLCLACWCWAVLAGKKRVASRSPHYIILTKNSHEQIEWMVRRLRFHAWLNGRLPRFTFLDMSGSAETAGIVERLMRRHQGWLICSSDSQSWPIGAAFQRQCGDDEDDGPVITIDMRKQSG